MLLTCRQQTDRPTKPYIEITHFKHVNFPNTKIVNFTGIIIVSTAAGNIILGEWNPGSEHRRYSFLAFHQVDNNNITLFHEKSN